MSDTAVEGPYQQNGQGPSSYASIYSGGSSGEKDLLRDCEEKVRLARNDRRKYEGTWDLCQSFLAGKQWVALSGGRDARVIALADTDEFKDRVRLTINVLTRYVWTAIGKVLADEIRPDFTFMCESKEAEEYLNQANTGWRYGYENEIHGDRVLASALLKELTYGTAAIRARYDFGVGPVVMQAPLGPDGAPQTNTGQAVSMVADAQEQGQTLQFRDIRAGALRWDDYAPQQIFAPPGIDDERLFPWLAIARAVDLDELKSLYPDEADGLQEQSLTSGTRVGRLRDASGGDSTVGKLKNHTIVYSLFHKPSHDKPNGCVVHWTQDRILDYIQTLPYEIAGVRKAGIVFLHWRKVPDRFWAIGMVEPAIGPQFELNRSTSQATEMKDKNLGRAWVTKGTITGINRPQGTVMEVIELAPGAAPPIETPGTQPGPWIREDAEVMKQHISDVMGMGAASLGQAPRGIAAYSAFAFLVEQDDRDLIVATKDIRDKAGELAQFSLQDIRNYWGPDKQIALAGPENQMQMYTFRASQLPSDLVVIPKKTVGVPTSASAEIQKIFDLFDRSIASGRPLPLDWLYESLKQGRALPLPKSQDATQRQKAELENMIMSQPQTLEMIQQQQQQMQMQMQQRPTMPGMPAPQQPSPLPPMLTPSPEDDDEAHVNVHVAGKVTHQMVPGQEMTVALFDMHIQAHIASAQQKMRAAALATQQAAGHEGPQQANANAAAGARQPQVSG